MQIITTLQSILKAVLPVMVSFGIVYFVWGVVQYVIAGGEEAKKKGRDRIIYGIIGLAVITGLWGLINVVINTFDLGGATPTAISSTCTIGKNFRDMSVYITCIIESSVIPLIFAIATLVFIWGVVKFFIIDADEEAKRTQGKQFMIWGLVAIAVMLCVWGLATLLGSTFGFGGSIPHTAI